MGDFRVAKRKTNSYSKPQSTPTKSQSTQQSKKPATPQNNNVPNKSTSTSGVQLTKSGGSTTSTKPMGMGDLKVIESKVNKNIQSSNTSQSSHGMGDLKKAESTSNKNTTRSSVTSQPSQGMGDLKVIESKNSNSNKLQLVKSVLSTGVDFAPVVGNIKSGIETVTGKDYITGEKLSDSTRAIAAVGMVAGGIGKGVIKGASKVADEVIEEVGKKAVPKVGNEIVQGADNLIKEVGKTAESSLGVNPFKEKTAREIDQMFRAKGFELRGPDPLTGKGGYINPKTGRSYHIDEANSYGEPPHVDVNRLRDYKGPLDKKKYNMGSGIR